MIEPPIQPFGEGIWTAAVPLRIAGAKLGARMTIVRGTTGLLLHSPIALTEPIREQLRLLENPQAIVAPNLYHHMFVKPYLEAYPEANFYTIPELSKRRPDLGQPLMITDDSIYPWSEDLDHFVFRGGRWFCEAIFFHRVSKTLILTDFAFNIYDTENWLVNFILKAGKSLGRFGQTPLERLLIRDRKALRQACDRIMAWNFENITLAHGEPIRQNARDVFWNALKREF